MKTKPAVLSILTVAALGITTTADDSLASPHPSIPGTAAHAGNSCSAAGTTAVEGLDQLLCLQVSDFKLWVRADIDRPVKHVQHIRVNRAQSLCDQPVAQIFYDTEVLSGKEWLPQQDDGRVALQLHFIGNGAPPETGLWQTVPTTPGGENVLRLSLSKGYPTWDLLRVMRTDGSGFISSPAKLLDCAEK